MKRRKGFTIVELVIVIAVIAILAAVLIPTFSTVIKKAKESHFLQNKRNEWLNEFVESSLDEDYETIKETPVEFSDEDAKIKQIESDFKPLFEYLLDEKLCVMKDPYKIHLVGIEEDFFDEVPGYSFVGGYGSGKTKHIYSYDGKYFILYSFHGDASSFEISFCDDVAIRDDTGVEGWIQATKPEVYYKLKIQKKDDSETEYEIKVEQYVRSQS